MQTVIGIVLIAIALAIFLLRVSARMFAKMYCNRRERLELLYDVALAGLLLYILLTKIGVT